MTSGGSTTHHGDLAADPAWTALHGFVSFELTGDAALLLADPETMYDELARRSVDTIYGVVAG